MTVAYGGEKVALYMNVDKTKWLAVGIGANNEHGIGQVMVNGKQVETAEEFCYSGSIFTNNGN